MNANILEQINKRLLEFIKVNGLTSLNLLIPTLSFILIIDKFLPMIIYVFKLFISFLIVGNTEISSQHLPAIYFTNVYIFEIGIFLLFLAYFYLSIKMVKYFHNLKTLTVLFLFNIYIYAEALLFHRLLLHRVGVNLEGKWTLIDRFSSQIGKFIHELSITIISFLTNTFDFFANFDNNNHYFFLLYFLFFVPVFLLIFKFIKNLVSSCSKLMTNFKKLKIIEKRVSLINLNALKNSELLNEIINQKKKYSHTYESFKEVKDDVILEVLKENNTFKNKNKILNTIENM